MDAPPVSSVMKSVSTLHRDRVGSCRTSQKPFSVIFTTRTYLLFLVTNTVAIDCAECVIANIAQRLHCAS